MHQLETPPGPLNVTRVLPEFQLKTCEWNYPARVPYARFHFVVRTLHVRNANVEFSKLRKELDHKSKQLKLK